MTTRVNLETFINTTLTNIQQSTSQMSKLQEQISTGKKINRPSDEPAGARKILNLRSEDLRLDQFSSNIQTATQSLEFGESVLQNTSNMIQRVQELTMQGVSDTVDQNGRNIIASEINQLLESVLQSANSSRSGRYAFAGTKTTTVPFEATRNSKGEISTVTYKGNREKIEYQIGPATTVQINQPGDEVFMDNKLFDTIIKIRDNLANGTVAFARNELDNLDNAFNSILNSIAKSGGVTSTLELVDNRIADTKLSLKDVLASTESADITELVLKLKEQENIFQASLASGALIFRTSILDFL
ncbi:MAG: flagellar hook-associated protein FlgL [Candidatus Scalindua rubra]|uniref:Flagellar hook-associated protein FlgL n=1 Tax=Candidatus Scalindua rubra TaxID=1872076 RepID=A0A1E3X971_9BACT|nr:MAG: flagellar hook-associated protein FlgL [Candidatus Scalindua rubra]